MRGNTIGQWKLQSVGTLLVYMQFDYGWLRGVSRVDLVTRPVLIKGRILVVGKDRVQSVPFVSPWWRILRYRVGCPLRSKL